MRGLLMAVVMACALAGTAGAQEQPASAAAMAQADVELRKLVGEFQPVIQIQHAAVDLLVKSIDLVDPALALAERRAPKREVQAWISLWEPGQRQKIADMRRGLKAVRTLQAKDYPLVMATRGAAGLDPDRMLSTPNRVRDLASATLDMVERITEDLKLGAMGNQTALNRLAHSLVSGPIALIESENTAMEISIAGLPRIHPQRALAVSFVDANLVVLELMKGVEQQLDDKAVDQKALAARMRGHIADGREHAEEATSLVDAFLKNAASDPEARTPLGQKVLISYGTYKDSAAIERQIYDYLEGWAGRVEKGEELTEVVADTIAFDKLVERRLELNMRRVETLGR
jgi:hypothetical protein